MAHKCGAAVCLALVVGNRVYSANVGDSRVVLCRNNTAINLTNDHKPVRSASKNCVRLGKTRSKE